MLAAALSYALSAIFARRMPKLGLKPIDVAAGQATAAAILLAPLALALDRPWTLPPPGAAAIASVLAIASLSTALAYVVYFRILAGAGATNVLLVTLLVPATSVLLGALALNERLAGAAVPRLRPDRARPRVHRRPRAARARAPARRPRAIQEIRRA